MKIQCPNCHTELTSQVLHKEGARLRCSACNQVFKFKSTMLYEPELLKSISIPKPIPRNLKPPAPICKNPKPKQTPPKDIIKTKYTPIQTPWYYNTLSFVCYTWIVIANFPPLVFLGSMIGFVVNEIYNKSYQFQLAPLFSAMFGFYLLLAMLSSFFPLCGLVLLDIAKNVANINRKSKC